MTVEADRRAFRTRDGGTWRDVSYRDADDTVKAVAAGLVALGIAPGDRVCLLAETRLEWMLAELGVGFAGALVVPIYPSSTAAQCAHIVRDADARGIVVENAAALTKVLPLLLSGMDLRIICLESGGEGGGRGDAPGATKPGPGDTAADVLARVPREARARIWGWDDLLARGREHRARAGTAAELDRRANHPGPDDPFTIIYTSGTTGNPKGVVLTHRNLLEACTSAIRAFSITPDDLHFLWLPLAHVLAREVAWVSLIEGQTIAFSSGLPRIKEDLTELRPTFFVGVPRVFEKFHSGVSLALKQGSATRRRLSAWALAVGRRHARAQAARQKKPRRHWLAHKLADRLVLAAVRQKLGVDRCRFLVYGGAPLAAEVAEFFHAIGVVILEGYGLTETTAACFVNRLDRFRFGTVGLPIDVVEHKIADDGEILVRGPSVFRAYWGDPAGTDAVIDGEGWFHTGDIGVLEDGFLRITDRKKDLIVLAGGKKVAPLVLETALIAQSPLIGHALVFGDRRPYCVAVVTPSDEAIRRFGSGDVARAAGHPDLVAEVKAAVSRLNATLASFESIKSVAVLPEEFTEGNGQLTPSLKVKRRVVVDRQRAIIEGLYG
ncbi:MAG TPA: long-chain fatty acid--CoA ligase [Polyangia bacterium]